MFLKREISSGNSNYNLEELLFQTSLSCLWSLSELPDPWTIISKHIRKPYYFKFENILKYFTKHKSYKRTQKKAKNM